MPPYMSMVKWPPISSIRGRLWNTASLEGRRRPSGRSLVVEGEVAGIGDFGAVAGLPMGILPELYPRLPVGSRLVCLRGHRRHSTIYVESREGWHPHPDF